MSRECQRGKLYAVATIDARTDALKANRANRQFASIGNRLDNGDTITHSPEPDGGAHPDTYEPVTEAQVMRESGRA